MATATDKLNQLETTLINRITAFLTVIGLLVAVVAVANGSMINAIWSQSRDLGALSALPKRVGELDVRLASIEKALGDQPAELAKIIRQDREELLRAILPQAQATPQE